MAKPGRLPKTKSYSAEFKLQAVKLSNIDGVQVKDVAEALDIHPFMLSRWRKEFREGRISIDAAKKTGRAKRISTEVEKLRRERKRNERELKRYAELKRAHALLEEEHALIKKAIRFTSIRNRTSSSSSKRKGPGSA